VETAEDVGVVQVLESASMYSSAHSQSLQTDIRNCNNEVDFHKNNSSMGYNKKSTTTSNTVSVVRAKNINKNRWVKVKSNSKHACSRNKNIVTQSSFSHKNKYNVLMNIEHCENEGLDVSSFVVNQMSGKWKVRPSKRASLHSDHDTSSGSSSYKPKIVSPNLNSKFQNCDLQSHQISKVRDTSLTSQIWGASGRNPLNRR
ncbi:hypothetical protein J6590_071598, partial [Homalodisca vitripennis]